MEEESEAILIALIIGAVILGVGFALFFIRPYTGFGAVVLAIGLMTISLILTMRAEEIIHLKIYPTTERGEITARVSAETMSSAESTRPSTQSQAQEPREPPPEVQAEQTQETPEAQEPEQTPQQPPETQRPYETYETSETYVEEVEEAAAQETSEEAEPNPEPTIEAAPPSPEQGHETEEYRETATTMAPTG